MARRVAPATPPPFGAPHGHVGGSYDWWWWNFGRPAGMPYRPVGVAAAPTAAFDASKLESAVHVALAQLQAFAAVLNARDMTVLGIGEHLSHAEEATAGGDFSRAISHMDAAAQMMAQLTAASASASPKAAAGTLGAVDSAFAAALWQPFYAQTGIRPEWIVPVLAAESGLNPSLPNQAGYPYYGLNQVSGSYLQARGIDPSDYLTWPASRQLVQVVTPFMAGQIAALGVRPQSGARVYQLNFLPATLRTATDLTSVIATRPAGGCPAGHSASYYCANAGFDSAHKGFIDVQDLADSVAKQAANPYVQSVIASAYAVAPSGVGPETDPVYGDDYAPGAVATGANWGPAIAVGASALAAIGLVAAYQAGYFDRRRPAVVR